MTRGEAARLRRIDAKVEHGMLTLGLQLHSKAQPRRIEVKVVNEHVRATPVAA
jgi:hypothetical protein